MRLFIIKLLKKLIDVSKWRYLFSRFWRQYKFGTTDVTRTISLKNSNQKIIEIFTRVLKGHIAVSNFRLKKNTSGSEIDKVARKYLNQINLDYAHGTGHGVGYFLNVHEVPINIKK